MTTQSSTANKTITVTAQPPPVTTLTVTPTTGVAPFTVSVNMSATNSPVNYQIELNGVRSTITSSSTGTVNMAVPGTSQFRARAGNIGGWGEWSSVVTVVANAPQLPPLVASFTANPLKGRAPLNVQFTDTSTGSGITSWSWEINGEVVSTNKNFAYTFTEPGDYVIKLTVTNTSGHAGFTSMSFGMNALGMMQYESQSIDTAPLEKVAVGIAAGGILALGYFTFINRR